MFEEEEVCEDAKMRRCEGLTKLAGTLGAAAYQNTKKESRNEDFNKTT
jgi:hypothetical protein